MDSAGVLALVAMAQEASKPCLTEKCEARDGTKGRAYGLADMRVVVALWGEEGG